jgi:hypothetical protein
MKWFRRKDPECLYWEDLLARFGVPGAVVQEVVRVEGGVQVHGSPAERLTGLRDLGPRLAVHKRLPRDAVRIEDEPADAAGFVIYAKTGT